MKLSDDQVEHLAEELQSKFPEDHKYRTVFGQLCREVLAARRLRDEMCELVDSFEICPKTVVTAYDRARSGDES